MDVTSLVAVSLFLLISFIFVVYLLCVCFQYYFESFSDFLLFLRRIWFNLRG